MGYLTELILNELYYIYNLIRNGKHIERISWHLDSLKNSKVVKKYRLHSSDFPIFHFTNSSKKPGPLEPVKPFIEVE
jgi:hypothetical protein